MSEATSNQQKVILGLTILFWGLTLLMISTVLRTVGNLAVLQLTTLLSIGGLAGAAAGGWLIREGSADSTIRGRAMAVAIVYGTALALLLLLYAGSRAVGLGRLGAYLSWPIFHHFGLFCVCILLVPLAELQGMIQGGFHYWKIARALYLVLLLLLAEMFMIYRAGFMVSDVVRAPLVVWSAAGVTLFVLLYLFLVRRAIARAEAASAVPVDVLP